MNSSHFMEPEGSSPGSHELPLSWSTPTPQFLEGQFILLFCVCQGIPSGLVLSGIPTKTLYAPLRYTCCMCRSSHSSRFDHLDNVWWGVCMVEPPPTYSL